MNEDGYHIVNMAGHEFYYLDEALDEAWGKELDQGMVNLGEKSPVEAATISGILVLRIGRSWYIGAEYLGDLLWEAIKACVKWGLCGLFHVPPKVTYLILEEPERR
jgi:hypothetical protein